MHALHNLLSIARYERILLMRTARFRILGGIGVFVPVLIGIGMAVLEARGVEFSSALGMGAFIPFYVYSYIQTIVIAFIVGDFRAADERAQIGEVIAGRPISTAELVIGKYLGVLSALLALSLSVLLLTVAIQAAKISFLGSPFTIKPYIAYLLLMTLPSLVYMSALTFFLGSVLRQQTAVALVSVAYALAVLFFLGESYGGIYDFGAFFAPLFYSDMMGLGDISRVIHQRFFYLALGLAFFGLAIERYPRLSQSRAWTWCGRGIALGGLAGALGLYQYMAAQDLAQEEYRQRLLAEQYRYAGRAAPQVAHYDLDLALAHEDVPLRCRAQMHLKNVHAEDLDTLVFTLNPGLALRAVRDAQGRVLQWVREDAVIRIAAPLAAAQEMVLTLIYEGDVERQAFDLHRDEARLTKSKWPFIKGDLTAWIRPASVFLPPRSRWYPVAGVDYGPEERPASFATARIAVSLPAGLEVVTQGRPVEKERAGDRVQTVWQVDAPVPLFSLNVGEYEVYEAQVRGIDCALYIDPVHRRQAAFFADAGEEVIEIVDQMLDAMEQETGLAYAYERLSLVEVPFLVQWYYEGWKENGGLTQPGILMLEEDVLMGHRFQRDFDRRMERSRGNQEPGQVKKDVLMGAIFQDFLSPEGERSGLFRSPLVQLWSFGRGFGGKQVALVQRGLPLYMQEDVSTDLRAALFASRRGIGRMGGGMARAMGGMRRGMGGGGMGGMRRPPTESGPDWGALVVEMQQTSLADMDPEAEPDTYRAVLKAKSLTLFRMIEAVVGEDGFVEALADFEKDHRYGQVSFADLERAVVPDSAAHSKKANVQRLVHDWIYGTHVPGYTLTRATARKMDDGWGMVVYQVIVRIRNGEPGRGFVQVQVMGMQDQAYKEVEIEGGQEVEVSLVLFARPFRVVVEPFFAKNQRPLVAPLRIAEKVYQGVPKSYVRDVSDEESFVSEIVVDNDDDGFSMPVRRVQRYLRPGLKGDNWQVAEMPFSFGRYETNFRWKAGGDGAQPAVWQTALPRKGDYDVAYYFVPPQFGRRFGLSWAESFTLAVFHGGAVDTLEFESAALKGGWNVLGRFHFEQGGEARVELSDKAGGRLYADAVRWRYVDPHNPEEVFEEDVASWGNFGRGRGGPGGRGGGRQPTPRSTNWLNRIF